MPSYCYEAVNASGLKSQGTLEVLDQNEALRRIKEMGLFPTRVAQIVSARRRVRTTAAFAASQSAPRRFRGRIKPAALGVFTRQLATLTDVGMPLLRGLRLLEEQAETQALKRVIADVAVNVESGGALSEALAAHPKVFSPLYVNMVKAGEIGGILELVLRRQAEFMEKALKVKGRVKAAMIYPVAVLFASAAILTLLMVFIVPRFQQVFEGLLGEKEMPGFTVFVLKVSELFKSHFLGGLVIISALTVAFQVLIRSRRGRHSFDHLKLSVPVLGRIFRKMALSRFARTFGTLLGSGVPVLQALTIVKETTGNTIVGGVIARVHDNVKEGGTITEPLKGSQIFPAMVAGMVDVGEQTGALPDMLMRIADIYDEEVDNAISAATALLEPVMIIFLAIIVGSIVIAMFLPLIRLLGDPHGAPGEV